MTGVDRRNPPSVGALVAAEAREWVGTRFVPHQSVKGEGCDCKGLLVGVARELGLSEADSLPAAVRDYDISRPPLARFRAGLAELFDPVEGEPQPGDIILLDQPVHVAICTEGGRREGRAVHAQIAPAERVKETRLRALLKNRPVDSIWRWRCR